MKTIFITVFCFLVFKSYSQEPTEVSVKTEVSEATIFIESAQVTRKKSIDLNQGKTLLKFTGLSPYVDPKSIQIKTSDNVMVLSVNHQFNYLDTIGKSKELETLVDKLHSCDDKLKEQNAALDIINEELSFLKENSNIGGRTQDVNLNNLKETSNFYHDKITSLKFKEIEVNKTISNISKEKNAIESQIKQTSDIKITPTSEVLVKIETKSPGKADFILTYLVGNAGWFPTYDIRAMSIDQPIELIYKANVHQYTKENWNNIKLRLSSTNPNKSGTAPSLKTYFLDYYTPPPFYGIQNNMVTGRVVDETNAPLIGANVVVKGTTIGTVTDINGNYSLSLPNNANTLTFNYVGYYRQDKPINSAVINATLNEDVKQLDEVVVVGYGTSSSSEDKSEFSGALFQKNSKVKIKGISSEPIPVTQVENQTSFEFEINVPYTVNSDNKNYTIDIDNYSLNADYEYYCVPKLDKDAFLVANIVDWEKYNLLEGEASLFFENTYIGKSVLDVRNIADTLSISLGRDKNVMVKRDKIKEFTKRQFFGSKKEETRDWQITVKSNKKQKINMVLYDQVPVSTMDEIDVSISNLSEGILNKEKGEIQWKFSLEPLAKKDIELKYTVKYPKDRTLTIE